jgi:uncharacterized protein (DUF433 family)
MRSPTIININSLFPLLFNQHEEKSMKSSIIVNPDICNGKPIIAGTRIPVQTVMEFLGAGDSIEEILEEYPSLSREDIYACLQFATKLMANHYEIRKVA